jgi:hypothetical protein
MQVVQDGIDRAACLEFLVGNQCSPGANVAHVGWYLRADARDAVHES